MIYLIILLNIACVIALGALAMTIWNLRLYRTAPGGDLKENASMPRISVCIPARNEEDNLAACVESVLANDAPEIEVLVYDDHSTDQTAAILARLCEADDRVRRVPTQPLPQGWNGKQFACDRMGRAATGQWLLFTDADVRFEPGALRSAWRAAHALNAELVSTFPRQRTGTLSEKLLLPMIFFILFIYLPMIRMRRTLDPAASAGCGQFLFVRQAIWMDCGGHGTFRDSMHDGIKLPRALRRNGHRTDLFDGTAIASVRMYHGLGATWRGFAKNAYEGLGSMPLLIFLTGLHLIGHVLPWVALIALALSATWQPAVAGLSAIAVTLHIAQRWMMAVRFDLSRSVTLLHPVSVVVMTVIQWHSAWMHLRGRRAWRGRIASDAPSHQSA